jgi:hypothetical protein
VTISTRGVREDAKDLEVDWKDPEVLGELEFGIRLELARRFAKEANILSWGRVLFPEKFNLGFCKELHDYLVEIRHEEFAATEAPRNHAKTTIECFLIPIFQALEEPKRYRHYLNVQATAPKALSVNLSIRNEIESNELLKELYGDQTCAEKWADSQFRLMNGVIFTAIGAGQSVRGLNYNNIRPDWIRVDDLYDDEDIHSPDSTEKKNAWFWSALYPARAKARACSIHIQGTAINQYDLLELLKERKRWKCRTFQAIKDWAKKKVLWPELNSWDKLMEDKEDMPSTIFFRELQNERRDDSQSIVKLAWLDGWEYTKIPEGLEVVARELGCDPSIGENEAADFTGACDVIITKRPDAKPGVYEYWIEWLEEKHLSLDGRCQLLSSRIDALERPINRAHVEGVAGFKDFVAQVRKRVGIMVREVSQPKNKLVNLENKSHHFENGRVHISVNIPAKLRETLKYQLTTNKPKHDDVRDAVLLVLPEATRGGWRPLE